MGIHFHLTVLIVDRRLPINLNEGKVTESLAWTQVFQNHDGMFRIGDIDTARCGERGGARHDVIHVFAKGDGRCYLFYFLGRVFGNSSLSQRESHCKG